MQPAWWPDWRGWPVAIVASGPSAKVEKLDILRGRVKVIAIKQSFELCPFADVVYGCDDAWWKHRNGLPEFGGLKIAWGAKACAEYPAMKRIAIKERPKKHPRDSVEYVDELVFDEPGTVGGGGNSGFQGLNLAVLFNIAPRILLIGFDVHDRNGVHWYGRNGWRKATNPEEHNFVRWRTAFQTAAKQLLGRGIEVINASPASALKCFPQRSIGQTLQMWNV